MPQLPTISAFENAIKHDLCFKILKVQNGQQVCLFLKKEDLSRTSKGTITLVLEVVYNKVWLTSNALKSFLMNVALCCMHCQLKE